VTDDGQRWVIVVEYLAAAVVMAGGLRAKLRNAKEPGGLAVSFAQRCSHVGGALVCFFVATGSLGVLFGWDTFLRLPFLIAAGALSVIGRGLEWREESRRRH
jgi:hypothetical protein